MAAMSSHHQRHELLDDGRRHPHHARCYDCEFPSLLLTYSNKHIGPTPYDIRQIERAECQELYVRERCREHSDQHKETETITYEQCQFVLIELEIHQSAIDLFEKHDGEIWSNKEGCHERHRRLHCNLNIERLAPTTLDEEEQAYHTQHGQVVVGLHVISLGLTDVAILEVEPSLLWIVDQREEILDDIFQLLHGLLFNYVVDKGRLLQGIGFVIQIYPFNPLTLLIQFMHNQS